MDMIELVMESILANACWSFVWEGNKDLRYVTLDLHCNTAWVIFGSTNNWDYQSSGGNYKVIWWYIQGQRSTEEMLELMRNRFPKENYVA